MMCKVILYAFVVDDKQFERRRYDKMIILTAEKERTGKDVLLLVSYTITALIKSVMNSDVCSRTLRYLDF